MLRTVRLRVRGRGGSAENMVALRAALQSSAPGERVEVHLTVAACPFAALWNEIASIYDVSGAVAPAADILVLVGEGTASPPKPCRHPVAVNIPWTPGKVGLSPDDKKVVTYCLLIGVPSLRAPLAAIDGLELICQFVTDLGSAVEVAAMGPQEGVDIPSVGVASDSSIIVPEAEDSDDDVGSKRENQVLGFCECCH